MIMQKEISYEDFGKLRFLDFFSKTKNYLKPWSGGVVLGIGSAAVEGYNLFTYFASPVKS